MTSKNLSSLTDIYQLLQTPQIAAQTSNILQFLWHDLTSEYDIVGLYFTCADSVNSKICSYLCNGDYWIVSAPWA